MYSKAKLNAMTCDFPGFFTKVFRTAIFQDICWKMYETCEIDIFYLWKSDYAHYR